MNWDNLRYFLELVRAGTLIAAAERLKVDHTTVSRRILALEGEIESQLFERRASGYQLTEFGKRLLAHVEAIESSTLAIESAISGASERVSGHVRIGATEGFGGTFLAPRLGAFTRRHPDLQIDLLATMPRVVNLSAHEADISITLERPPRGRYVIIKLTDYTLRLYGSATYLDGHRPIRGRDDLRGHTFIGYIDNLVFSKKLNYLGEVCDAPRVALRSTSIAAQLHAAAGDEGLAILPPFMAREYPNLKMVLPSEIRIQRSFWMCAHAERRDLARVKVAWNYLKELVAGEQQLLLS